MVMRIGISTPGVINVPRLTAEWERQVGAAEITWVAQQADRLGFHFVTCSEHVGVPPGGWSPRLPGGRGTRYWDPLATLSYLAAQTERLRLVTSVLVLGYHHPLAIAKRYGTLDQLSGGRVTLGLGVGTMREEFETLGVPFEGRGPRADDAIRALRVALTQHEPEYHGEYYDFGGLVIDPNALQPHVPLWIGGHSRRALRRAIELGDGWMPGAPDLSSLRSMLAAQPDRPESFEVIVGSKEPFDPLEQPGQVEKSLAVMEAAGVTMVTARFVSRSLTHYLEQLEALAALDSFTPL